MSGHVVFRFADGSVERVPIEKYEKRLREIRSWLSRNEYGPRGGKASAKRPRDLLNADILLNYFEKRAASSPRRARMRLTAALAKQHGVTMRTARSWVDGALGDLGKAKK